MKDKILEAFEGTRKAGAIASGALDQVAKIVKPGIRISLRQFTSIYNNTQRDHLFIIQRL